MNQNFNLSINKPCSENFNQFNKTEAGGFCGSCEKEVIDFRNMTPNEIMNHFKNNEGKTCGIFNTPQLKTYTPETIRNSSKFNFITGLSFSLLSMAVLNTAQAQTTKEPTVVIEQNTKQTANNESKQEKEFTISGIVAEGTGPLPGASIVLQGTTVGTETDFDGKFTFPKKLKKGDVLIISFIGYGTKKVTIKNDEKLNFAMKIDMTIDSCMILGEVEVQKVYKSKKSLWRKLKQ